MGTVLPSGPMRLPFFWWLVGFASLSAACSSSTENVSETGGSAGTGGTSTGGSGGAGTGGGGTSAGGTSPGGGGGGTSPSGGGGGGSGTGGAPSCDPGAFPSNPLRDDFNRPDGPVGSSWLNSDTFQIVSNQVAKVGAAPVQRSMLWPTKFGANQEAYVTLSEIHSQFEEMTLILKAQNQNDSCPSIAVLYAPSGSEVQVWWCVTPGQWKKSAGVSLTFSPKQQLAGRALQDGTVIVLRDGAEVLTTKVPGALGTALDGYIGISADINGAVAAFDDFGGGDVPCN